MNLIPRFRRGALCCALSFPAILLLHFLRPAVLTPESIATTCVPTIECREDYSALLYPVDPGGLNSEATATIHATDLLMSAASDCSDALHYSIYFLYQVESGEVIPQAGDPDSIVVDCNYCGRYTFLLYVWDDQNNPDSVQPDGTIGGPNYSYCEARVLVSDAVSICNCDYQSIIFPESKTFNTNTNDYNQDFIAIKIGDVNSSATTSPFTPETESPDSRGMVPERTVQPFLQFAPEYGAAVGMTTDTCAPVIDCINGFAGELLPLPPNSDPDGDGDIDEGGFTVFADDFIESGISSCGGALHYSMYRLYGIETGVVVPDSGDPDSLVLACDDCGIVQVRIYAWDDLFNPEAVQPDGTVGGPNYSYCETYILVQDNFSACNCESPGLMSWGVIETEESEGVSGVLVKLSGAENTETTTPASGTFFIYAQSYFWQTNTYTIRPELDGEDKNGVTNFDIVLISRHILNIQPLGSPYKIIAADVNKDEKITIADLIHIRRLILNLDTAFVHNTSWRFVWADYLFPVETNPWFEVFPESRTGTGTSLENDNTDFVAIKIGDVNSSATTSPFTPEMETPASRGAAPERTVQPFLQPAPEYGAAVGMATDTCTPVIECLLGLTFEPEPAEPPGSGTDIIATLQGSDLVASAGSACSDALQYSVYRSDDIVAGLVIPGPNQDSVLLNCGQDCLGTVILRVYVWDDNFNPDAVQPDGTVGGPNYAFCETYVLITDAPFCECNGNGITLHGVIETEAGDGLKNVSLALTGLANETTTSDTSGYFEFDNLMPGSYALSAELDLFPKNGVSTIDVLLISRHLLGIQPLGSPYKMIAADVNNDKKITTIDLVHLRRLILGIDTEFVANTSWRFVPADYIFPVPTNPWFEVFSGVPDLSNLTEDTQFDFIAIKIGDVNGSASTSLLIPEVPDPRGAAPERTVQPFLQPAPEYGAAVGMATDTCAPVIECIVGQAIELFPLQPPADTNGNGSLDYGIWTAWAADFVETSGSACSDSLRFSIHKLNAVLSGEEIPHPDQPGLFLTCDDLGIVPLRIYVWDDNFNPDAVQPDGTVGGPNYSYCETFVLVQDNQFDLCNTGTSITGVVETEESEPVGCVKVTLSGATGDTIYTGPYGSDIFDFIDWDPAETYTVTPHLDSLDLNGLSGFDIILIHRHILHTQLLPGPYKQIAADVNGDNKITSLDLIRIRQLILGLDHTIANNTSWRFIPSDYIFPDPTNAWFEAFPESQTISGGSPGYWPDFIAIKVGDVNSSADTCN